MSELSPLHQRLVDELKSSLEYFDRSAACLTEEDADFCPKPDMMTAAQQTAHVGLSVDWFMEGVFGPEFDMDFEGHIAAIQKFRTMGAARQKVRDSYANAIKTIEESSVADLEKRIPPGPVMGGLSRHRVVEGIVDHTAHHRGALTVYSRVRGHVPTMPYMAADPAAQ